MSPYGHKLKAISRIAQKPAKKKPPANAADAVIKGIGACALLLLLTGFITPVDFAIIAGLGFIWFTRTTTL